ncbi:hypothetical protein ABZ756_01980 [Mammaliicoccus sciuri]
MLVAMFESKKKDFFNLPSNKADFYKMKEEENNLGKKIAANIFKDINRQKESKKENN